jgi:hypothetical protein
MKEAGLFFNAMFHAGIVFVFIGLFIIIPVGGLFGVF